MTSFRTYAANSKQGKKRLLDHIVDRLMVHITKISSFFQSPEQEKVSLITDKSQKHIDYICVYNRDLMK